MGNRRVGEVRKKLNILEEIARMLNVKLEEVVERVEKLKKEVEEMERKLM